MNSVKVRIYELSRELNLGNQDILAICEQLNISAKSHSSTITEAEAQRIRAAAADYTPSHHPSNQADLDRNGSISSRVKDVVPQSMGHKKQQILEVRKLTTRAEFSSAEADTEIDQLEHRQSPQALSPPVRPTRTSPVRDTAPSSPPVTVSEPVAREKPAYHHPVEPAQPQPRAAKEAVKPKLELAGPPTKPVAASAKTLISQINRPTLRRDKPAPSPGQGPERQLRPGESAEPVNRPVVAKSSATVELQRPQLIRPNAIATPPARRSSTGTQEAGITTLAGPGAEELLLNRPAPPVPARLAKRTSPQEEEDDGQDLLGKAKPGTKGKRRVQTIEEDEDEDFGTGLNAQTAVDISLSLVRPPKPKGVKQAKPTAAIARMPVAAKDKKASRSRDRRPVDTTPERPERLVLTGELTVQELASELMIPETEVIKVLFFKGFAANINQTLDIPTATMVAQELGFEVETVEQESKARKVTEMLDVEDLENLQSRPPVITIMGHVDHGKTTLLDAIRKTKVAQGEAGGITQHIGAYHVDVEHDGATQQVVFLDTPGHEAFTAMRARGARVTDIAILVVAADDGVRPQTIEAISHARAAGVPIIVAINKIDKEGAQPDRVKQELTEYNLLSEEWGGETIMVPVSAIHRENLDTLLEMILLVAEVEDLHANPNRPAKGTIIEAHLDKARGPVATFLVQNGTLRVGDTLVAGSTLGKVRAMVDDRGHRVEAAGPSFAVEVLGLGDVPAAGDEFECFPDEKAARVLASDRTDQQRQSRLQQAMASRRVSLSALSDQAREGELKELNLLLKADVQGSVEAILGALGQLPQEEVQVRVLLAAPGEVTETDVDLAAASDAVIIGFNTTLASGARQAADEAGVDIREYNIIYKLLEDIEGAMEGLLEPELVEEALGQAEVRAVFPVGRGAVAGCYVQSGKLVRNCKIRIRRGGNQIHEGVLDSLKRMKEDAREVNSGYECGVRLDSFHTWVEGDIIEAYRMVTKRRTLSPAS